MWTLVYTMVIHYAGVDPHITIGFGSRSAGGLEPYIYITIGFGSCSAQSEVMVQPAADPQGGLGGSSPP